ncbi:PP2C family protein-serine/threonine phosphatase [Propionibacterium sp.]|uniref:PP2C family protein-serine/threonine phosphatase n=1 Tax=Propionibacterium sp. TaxID=1977903 RepID=UPI0039EB110B
MTSQQPGDNPGTIDRDDVRRGPTSWAGGATHVGSKSSPNQDALAIAATSSSTHRSAIVAVSDGVSTSPHSDVASQLAVDRATDTLISMLTDHDHHDQPGDLAEAMRRAVLVANESIVEAAGDDTDGYACTLVLALVHKDLVVVANMGDSRAYWFGDDGTNLMLTTDDSMAQLSIELGVTRDVAEASSQAHAITKWLGPNAPDLQPQLGGFRVAGPGWLLVCSDGLWNYASSPEDLRAIWDELPQPGELTAEAMASELIDWANGRGGHDNITVGLVRAEPAAVAAPAEKAG